MKFKKATIIDIYDLQDELIIRPATKEIIEDEDNLRALLFGEDFSNDCYKRLFVKDAVLSVEEYEKQYPDEFIDFEGNLDIEYRNRYIVEHEIYLILKEYNITEPVVVDISW